MISEPNEEVLTGPERRRRWSVEQKLARVAEMMRPGSSATQVARRYGISSGLLCTWRRLARTGALSVPSAPAFMPLQIAPEPADGVAPSPSAASGRGTMVIALPNGRRLEVDRHVDAGALRRVLSVLAER